MAAQLKPKIVVLEDVFIETAECPEKRQAFGIQLDSVDDLRIKVKNLFVVERRVDAIKDLMEEQGKRTEVLIVLNLHYLYSLVGQVENLHDVLLLRWVFEAILLLLSFSFCSIATVQIENQVFDVGKQELGELILRPSVPRVVDEYRSP